MTKGGRKKSLIVEEARTLFARYGLEKTTTEDIAGAVGMQKGALYYYFRSKEEIFTEVICAEIQNLKAVILGALNEQQSAGESLTSFVMTRMKYLRQKADEYTTVKDEYLKHYEFIEKLRARHSKWEIDTLRSILDKGVKCNEFTVSNTRLVAETILLALKGLEYTWATGRTHTQLSKQMPILLDILLEGLNCRHRA